MKPQTVMGIDPSLTGTAVAVLKPDGAHESVRFSSAPAPGLPERFDRYRGLCDQVMRAVKIYRPGLVLIEGYSFMSRNRGHHDTTEYGSLLRKSILDLGISLREVPPTSLKLFACGRGNGDKLAVATSLVERYGVRFSTNDEFDAYALARMAGCFLGWFAPADEAQQRALACLTPKAKEKKGRSCKTSSRAA